MNKEDEMELKQIGKSSDWESKCGMFRIIADNDNLFGAYWPCMREGDGQDKIVKFRHLSKNYMSFGEAKNVLGDY